MNKLIAISIIVLPLSGFSQSDISAPAILKRLVELGKITKKEADVLRKENPIGYRGSSHGLEGFSHTPPSNAIHAGVEINVIDHSEMDKSFNGKGYNNADECLNYIMGEVRELATDAD